MERLPCLDSWVAASVEELDGWSILAYVGLLVLGSLLLSEATGVFAWGLCAAIGKALGGSWRGGWWVL